MLRPLHLLKIAKRRKHRLRSSIICQIPVVSFCQPRRRTLMRPVTRYAKSGDVHIAYQMFGDGPVDLVTIMPFVSNVEVLWEEPGLVRWMQRLGSYARIIMFDKRGTGMSDRVSELPGMDQRMDDARAVMDAAGISRA